MKRTLTEDEALDLAGGVLYDLYNRSFGIDETLPAALDEIDRIVAEHRKRLREQIAAEIEAINSPKSAHVASFLSARNEAARIARGND